MKKPRKPKLKKFPKAPKASASLDVLKRYQERVRGVEKDNDARMSAYNKDLKAFESAEKAKKAIRDQAIKARKKY